MNNSRSQEEAMIIHKKIKSFFKSITLSSVIVNTGADIRRMDYSGQFEFLHRATSIYRSTIEESTAMHHHSTIQKSNTPKYLTVHKSRTEMDESNSTKIPSQIEVAPQRTQKLKSSKVGGQTD